MVLLHVKARAQAAESGALLTNSSDMLPLSPCPQNSEQDQFLLEVPAHTVVAEAVRQVAEVHNLRHRITRLKLEGGELAKYGPAKHPDQQGIDEYAEQPAQQEPHYNMDPTGRRTGHGEQAAVGGMIVPLSGGRGARGRQCELEAF